MQCREIPDKPILLFLGKLHGQWGTLFPGHSNSVRHAMPSDIPDKLALAKMRMLIRKGLVDGCGCGCRGDFELTGKGYAALEADDQPTSQEHLEAGQ